MQLSAAVPRVDPVEVPRPPRRGSCSRPKTSGRRWTGRLTPNVYLSCSASPRCLLQTFGYRRTCCDPGFSLGGVLSKHRHPTRLFRVHHRCHARGGGWWSTPLFFLLPPSEPPTAGGGRRDRHCRRVVCCHSGVTSTPLSESAVKRIRQPCREPFSGPYRGQGSGPSRGSGIWD